MNYLSFPQYLQPAVNSRDHNWYIFKTDPFSFIFLCNVLLKTQFEKFYQCFLTTGTYER